MHQCGERSVVLTWPAAAARRYLYVWPEKNLSVVSIGLSRGVSLDCDQAYNDGFTLSIIWNASVLAALNISLPATALCPRRSLLAVVVRPTAQRAVTTAACPRPSLPSRKTCPPPAPPTAAGPGRPPCKAPPGRRATAHARASVQCGPKPTGGRPPRVRRCRPTGRRGAAMVRRSSAAVSAAARRCRCGASQNPLHHPLHATHPATHHHPLHAVGVGGVAAE